MDVILFLGILILVLSMKRVMVMMICCIIFVGEINVGFVINRNVKIVIVLVEKWLFLSVIVIIFFFLDISLCRIIMFMVVWMEKKIILLRGFMFVRFNVNVRIVEDCFDL